MVKEGIMLPLQLLLPVMDLLGNF